MYQVSNTPAPRHRVRDAVVPALIVALMITVFSYTSHGISLLVTFIPAAVLAYVVYLLTSYRQMPDPQIALPAYLFALAWQFVHFCEEFSTGFAVKWPVQVFHAAPYSSSTYVFINLLSYAAFVVGGIAILKGWRIPMVIAWFFIIQGVLGNGVEHMIWPVLAHDGWYFPGFFTALVYLVMTPVVVMRMIARPRVAYAG